MLAHYRGTLPCRQISGLHRGCRQLLSGVADRSVRTISRFSRRRASFRAGRQVALAGGLLAGGMLLTAGRRTPAPAVVQTQQHRVTRFALEEVQTFGAPGLDAQKTRARAGGDILVAIAAIAEGRDGALYVLDQSYKKVVVFDPGGKLRRVVLGGHGQGPGEFMFPTAMDLTSDGRLAVFDYGLNRVTFFDSSGTFSHSVVTDRAKDVVVTDDTIWGSGMPGRDHMVWAYPASGGARRWEIVVDRAHRSFDPTGAVARLGRGAQRELLVADDRPGIWYTRTGGAFTRRGLELFPGARFAMLDGIAVPPASTIGIGTLEGGRIAIAYVKHTFPGTRQGRPTHAYFIGMFNAQGEVVGEIPLGGKRVAVFATSRDGRFVYLPRSEPYPQVVKYRVVSR